METILSEHSTAAAHIKIQKESTCTRPAISQGKQIPERGAGHEIFPLIKELLAVDSCLLEEEMLFKAHGNLTTFQQMLSI